MKRPLWFIIIVLLIAIVGLQYRLWWGQNSMRERAVLKQKIAEQRAANQLLINKNKALMKKVEDLRTGHQELEARARKDLGMVKQGETFFLYIPEPEVKTADE